METGGSGADVRPDGGLNPVESWLGRNWSLVFSSG